MDIAAELALAGAKMLRAAQVALNVTTPAEGRDALRKVASILADVPGQDELVPQLRTGAEILSDQQVLELCRQIASTLTTQAGAIAEAGGELMNMQKKKWWQFWK
jgi:hypothetical protein